jgi:hypothetical protein
VRRIENSQLDSERTGESGEADRGPAPWSVFQAIEIFSTLNICKYPARWKFDRSRPRTLNKKTSSTPGKQSRWF